MDINANITYGKWPMPPPVNQLTLGERVSALEATVAVKAASICADINEVKSDFKELKDDIADKFDKIEQLSAEKFDKLSGEISTLTTAQSQRLVRDKVVGSVLEFMKLVAVGLIGFFAQLMIGSGHTPPPGH